MSKRAIIYRRVSSEDQKKNNSPSAQQTDGLAYAGTHNLTVIDSLLEDFTGTTIDRPMFNRLLEFIDAGLIDAVIVQHPDRLGRGPILELAIALLAKRGVEVHACNRGLISDEDDENAQVQNGLDGLVSGIERRNIQRRTQRGLLEKAITKSRLPACGSAPYGYAYVGQRKERTLVIAEQEAQIVRHIFEWYLAGDSVLTICKRLEAMRVESPSVSNHNNKKKQKDMYHWARTAIQRILRRRTYIGEFAAFARPYYVKGLGKPISPTPVIVPVPAILPIEVFEAVQSRLDRGRELARNNKKYFYLLQCLARCPCGRRMTGHDRGRYYQCGAAQHPHDATKRCTNGSYRVRNTEAAVWAWIEEHVLTEENLLVGIQQKEAQEATERDKLEEERSYFANRIAAIEREAERLKRLYIAELYTLEEITRDKHRLDRDRAELENRLADVYARLTQVSLSAEATERLLMTIRALKAKAANLSNEGRREVLEMLETSVVMYKRDDKPWVHIEVRLTFQETDQPIVPHVLELEKPA